MSHWDREYVTRFFLAALAHRGDAKAAVILELLSGERAIRQAHGAYRVECRVVIAVCTAKRPMMLYHCLQSIVSQIVTPRVQVGVVAVDNEAEPNGRIGASMGIEWQGERLSRLAHGVAVQWARQPPRMHRVPASTPPMARPGLAQA